MMMVTVLDQIRARGDAAAKAGVARAGDAVASVAATELPGVTSVRDGDDVVLHGRGLRARAFGTRKRAADPRVARLLTTLKLWSAAL